MVSPVSPNSKIAPATAKAAENKVSPSRAAKAPPAPVLAPVVKSAAKAAKSRAASPPPTVAPSTTPPAPAAKGRKPKADKAADDAPSTDKPEKAEKTKRAFTVFSSSIAHLGGRYISNNPEAAAKKAGHQQFHQLDKQNLTAPEFTESGSPVIVFSLRENGEKKKVRVYKTVRVLKDEPDRVVRVIKGGNQDGTDREIIITHKFNYETKLVSDMPADQISEILTKRRKRRSSDSAEAGDGPSAAAPPAAEKPLKTTAAKPSGKKAPVVVVPPPAADPVAKSPAPKTAGRKASR